MLETIAVKDQRTNWPNTLFSIVRVPKQHAGWRSATYLGKRYQVFGGIRGDKFIDLSNSLTKWQENEMFETREQYLNAALQGMAPWFESPFPDNVNVSCGWPSKSALAKKKRRIGEAWASECSKAQKFELFISPMLDKPIDVLAVLLHEMVHAYCGLKCGHKNPFKKTATALGLEGKMTATVPGVRLVERLNVLSKTLGTYPHGSLDSKMTNGEKKQGTRLLPCECPACGYKVRVTQKWLDIGLPICPCGEEMQSDNI